MLLNVRHDEGYCRMLQDVMGCYVVLWDVMGCYGVLWDVMGYYGMLGVTSRGSGTEVRL